LSASAFGIGVLKPGTLQVTVSRQVTRDDLHTLIDRIAKQHGCMACGLGGLDLVIRTQDPIFDVISEGIASIKEVSVYR
jgi:hypothetical protein